MPAAGHRIDQFTARAAGREGAEIRNSRHPSETNPKTEAESTMLAILAFGLISDFRFRASDFPFQVATSRIWNFTPRIGAPAL